MCTVNAVVGKEAKLPLVRAEQPKKVAVIGGGPAGMEAARVCTLRGHKVTLFEKRKLGGVLHEASTPEFKADIRRLIDYFVTRMKKLLIEVVYQEADVATIKGGKFDAVILAAGAAARKPDVPGIDKSNVLDALDVFGSEKNTGQKIHVVGGGIIGAEAALYLAKKGKDVVLTTRQEEIMSGSPSYDKSEFEKMLADLGVRIYTVRTLEAITDKGSVIVDGNGGRQEVPADNVVLASGYTPQTAIRDELENVPGLEVYAVGDCVAPRMIFDAIHEGHIAARKI